VAVPLPFGETGGSHPYGAEPVSPTGPVEPTRGAPAGPPPASDPPTAGQPATGSVGALPSLPPDRRLPRSPASAAAGLFWVGAHGGAGVSTLAALIEGTATLGARWPLPPTGPVPTVLVSRTSHTALEALRDAAIDYASGGLATLDLVGWVFIRDAPGKLPAALRDRMTHLAGAAPRDKRGRALVWDLPWVESWRLGSPAQLDTAPRAYRTFAADLTDLVPALRGGLYPTTLTGDTP